MTVLAERYMCLLYWYQLFVKEWQSWGGGGRGGGGRGGTGDGNKVALFMIALALHTACATKQEVALYCIVQPARNT